MVVPLGGGTVLVCYAVVAARRLGQLRTFPGDKSAQIVAIGPIGTEVMLIKKAFDPAPEANLVGMVLRADGPAHFSMPASAKHYHRGAGQSCSHDPKRP